MCYIPTRIQDYNDNVEVDGTSTLQKMLKSCTGNEIIKTRRSNIQLSELCNSVKWIVGRSPHTHGCMVQAICWSQRWKTRNHQQKWVDYLKSKYFNTIFEWHVHCVVAQGDWSTNLLRMLLAMSLQTQRTDNSDHITTKWE